MSKETTNFLQVGRMIECGSCHPEKYPDCKTLTLIADPVFKDYKCDCVCHDLGWEKLKSEFYKLDGQLAQGWHYSGEIMSLWARVLNLLSNQRAEILEKVIEKLPKEYDDKKLGSTDLTPNEMFNRGFNSAIIQSRQVIKELK